MRPDPLQWLSQLPIPSGLELAARSAFETGRLELGRASDQALAAYFRRSAPAWPRGGAAHVGRIRRDIEARIAAFEQDGCLDEPNLFHPAPPEARVRVVRPRLSIPGWTPEGLEALEFPSEWALAHGQPGGDRWGRRRANHLASGWMLAHRELDRPWLLCIHGYGMGLPGVDSAVFRAAQLHERLGINVAGLTLPLHGRRAGRSLGARELIQTSPLDMLHAHAQAVWDARRLIGWMRELGARQIAVHGFSLGGVTASLLAGLDSGLAGVIAGAPAFEITESYRSAAADEVGGPVPDRDDPIWERVRRMFQVVSPLHLAPVLGRERLALYAGLVDQLVPSDSVAALANHWRSPKSLWYSGGHLGIPLDAGVAAFVEDRVERALLDAPDSPG